MSEIGTVGMHFTTCMYKISLGMFQYRRINYTWDVMMHSDLYVRNQDCVV